MATELESKMEKAIEATNREFARLRTGQASPAMLNDVKVEYYGTPTPISQLATVKVPEPRMLLVTPWEKQFVDPICKAILAANLGLNPSKEGDSVRVAMPILTAERRQELVKMAKKHAEDGRTAIRNIRREANDAVKKNKELPEDESKKQMENIQKTTDKYIEKIDTTLAEKEADILKV
ncbi:MAG: ribosome recycling factor [Fibromonadaceae bacterium]|jgi:ribosome recycling factor|nr:ribosome recycling factor [Fibromonadaceae bacterium]